jgi:beta-xylosidase
MVAMLMTTVMGAQGVKPLPSLHVEGKWLVDSHGNHVVLHGVMDTPSAWFNNGRWGWSYDDAGRQRCIDYFEKLFSGLEKAHCNVFRLHLEPAWTNDPSGSYTWDGATGQASDASGEADIRKFNPTRLTNYLKTLYFPLMQRAMKHGMYVVVRPPGVCPGTVKVGDYYQKYLLTVWDIFTKNDSIRKYAGQISIELANEPVGVKNSMGSDDKKALHDFFQPVADKIRANGFKGIIWIPGSGWQSGYADYATNPITGYNIGYAVHDYDGWYGCEDKKWSASDVPARTQEKIKQFHNQVPVVDTNPVIITEIDWSPKKPGTGHYNEHGEWVESNYGTWATGRTSVWGKITKGVHDHYGNISMTLSGTACLIDIDTLINKNKVVPAFDGLEEACGKACMDWYAEYYNQNYPKADLTSVPVSDMGATYQNPIVRADFPDPDVIRVGNTYYMVSTTMHNFPGATILKSQDMVNWEYCAHPLQQLSNKDGYNLLKNTNAYASGMWACSMKYHNGTFYILINEKLPTDGWNLQGWLLTATNPEGKWTARKLSRSYYDPGMLFDEGKVYVACGIGNIVMCELDEKFNFKREQKVISDKDGLEGCHLYKKDGYYYIYATYGGWPSGQTVFRSQNIFGPYEEKMVVEKSYNNVPNTIHQGALIEDVKGKWWTIMQEDLGALGRMPNLQPVNWVSGWPVVGSNGTPYKSFVDKRTKPSFAGDNRVKRLPTTDVFRTYPLGMQWEWNHNPDNTAWSLFERPGWLRLKAMTKTTTLPQARNILTQRIFAKQNKPSTGTVRLDVRGMNDGDRSGICILQDPFAAIAVEKTGDKYQFVWWQDKVRDAGSNFTAAEKTKEFEIGTDSIVYLRAAIKYGENKTSFYYSLDNNTWTALGSQTSLSFNLSVFVGARFGLFNYATKSTGGVVDFDWFSTEDDFAEEELFPDNFTAPTENMFRAVRIQQSPTIVETMVGSSTVPNIKATYKDNHAEQVNNAVSLTPEQDGIVEFHQGQMYGVGQGSTSVKASYTDVLGNTVETSFTARSSYFPLDYPFVKSDFNSSNVYRYNNTYGVFKFGADNAQMGWVFNANIDLSDYKYLVVKLYSRDQANCHLNIYANSTKLTGACYSSPKFGNVNTFVLDLDTCKYNSTTSKGVALNKKQVRMVTFTGALANKTLSVKEIFLSNDEQYNTTGIVSVEREQGRNAEVKVYDLSGRLVRNNVKRQEATKGLPAGLYIVDGKKTLIR